MLPVLNCFPPRTAASFKADCRHHSLAVSSVQTNMLVLTPALLKAMYALAYRCRVKNTFARWGACTYGELLRLVRRRI